MLKVFQVVQHLRPGGLENMVLDIQQFSGYNDNTWVISLEGDHKTALTQWPKLASIADRLIFLNKSPGFSLDTYLWLTQMFKQELPDVVHTHHIGPLLYAGTAARAAGVKVRVHTEHDAWHLNNTKRRWLQKMAVKLSNPIIVADGHAVASSLESHLGISDIQTIPNGIDTNRFCPGPKLQARKHLKLPSSVRLVGCSGRMEAVKNQEMLICALRFLPDDVHLALAGHGSCYEQLKYRTMVEGLSHRVHFLGHTDNMPRFYQSLDLFCLPSLNEGFPLAPLEAQACGIQALVSDVGCSKDTLCPASGKVLPNHHAKDAAVMIAEMLEQNISSSPREFITRHFDVRTMAKAYDELSQANYQSLAGDSK